VIKIPQINLYLLLFCLLAAEKNTAQVIPTTVRVIPRDTLIDIKESSFFKKIADRYTSDSVEANKKGIAIKPGATIGIGYRIRTTKNNETPFGREHSLSANYGINRGAFFIEYKSIFNQLAGEWDLVLNARADIINVMNYYGVGNESQRIKDDDYYELRSREWLASVGLSRDIDFTHFLEFKTFFQSVKIQADPGQFITDVASGTNKDDFDRNNYLGLNAGYRFQNRDNQVNPSNGWDIGLQSSYTINLHDQVDGFARFTSYVSKITPLGSRFTLANRIGASKVLGDPEFYQLSFLGGRENLRGFRRQRFYGRTAAFLNNEIRWLFPTRKKFFQSMGFLGFADAGRVWHPGEPSSNTIHTGYGGGLLIIPYDRIVLNGTMGFSEEGRVIHFRLGFLF
jgi:hypothetical protein